MPSSLAVRTTFGFLLSEDGGGRFRWVCEEIVGYAGQQDPAIALFGDGTLASAALEGAFVSHDGGCSHQRIEPATSIDFTVSRSEPSRGLLVTSTFVKGVHEARILATDDDAHTFTVRSALAESFYPDTIDIAPSLPSRVYLSGSFASATALVAALDRSDDGGATFTRQEVDLAGDNGIFIAAVDPERPDTVYARTSGKVEDRLLVSKDGGKTLTVIATAPGGLLGVALSPDGSRLAIGGPTIGVRVASRDTLVFEQRSATPVSCLAWVSSGLHACGAGTSAGFSVARSTDDGATFTPLLTTLNDICGPLDACGTGSAFQTTCGPRWPAIAATFGGDGVDRCANGAGGGGGIATGGASGGGDGGGGGASGGNTAGVPGGGNTGGSSGAPSAAMATTDAGGCALGAHDQRASLPLLALVAGALARRRRGRHSQPSLPSGSRAQRSSRMGLKPP